MSAASQARRQSAEHAAKAEQGGEDGTEDTLGKFELAKKHKSCHKTLSVSDPHPPATSGSQ